MIFRLSKVLTVVLLLAAASACDGPDGTIDRPPPAEYSGEAIGYFCGMMLAEHGGPKGQVHLRSREAPLWFSSVRDTVAFTLLAGEPKDVSAIYVNDMARATNWQSPEPGTWIEAQAAWYVIGSRRTGGMGLPEVVPFGTAEAARNFAESHGGEVVRLSEVPADYVLGTPELQAAGGKTHGAR